MPRSLISSRITATFAALFAILVVIFLVSVHGASRLAELNGDVTHGRTLIEEIERTRSILREVESARRGYLLTRENEFLELFLALTKQGVAHLDRLRDLTADDAAQRRRVDAIGPLVARQLALVTDVIAASDRTRDPAAARPPSGDGAVVTQQILGLVAELQDTETTRLWEREAEANARTMKVIRGFGVVALVALLLLGGAYYVLDRDAAVHAAVLEELHMYTGPLSGGTTDGDDASDEDEHAPPDEHALPH